MIMSTFFFYPYLLKAAAVLYGFMAGTVCNFATKLKFVLNIDDTLDVSSSLATSLAVGS